MIGFQYSILRFVPDPIREEAVNLGVLVVSEDGNQSTGRFNHQFRGRVRSLASDFPFEQVEATIQSLEERCSESMQPRFSQQAPDERILHPPQLAALAAVMENQFQLTPPRRYLGTTLRAAADELYRAFVSVSRRSAVQPRAMTRQQLREHIWKTIRFWGKDRPLTVSRESRMERGRRASHAADFWIRNGLPAAAIFAIPSAPADIAIALAYRDSIPTVLKDMREVSPSFQVVAVMPSFEDRSALVEDTRSLLEGIQSVNVVDLEGLPPLEQDLVRRLL